MPDAAIPQTKSVARRRLPLRWVGGVLVLLLCFTAYLDRIAYSVTASPLMDELGITPVQFGMVTTLFSAGYFLAQMPAAALLQRFGSLAGAGRIAGTVVDFHGGNRNGGRALKPGSCAVSLRHRGVTRVHRRQSVLQQLV